MSNNTITYSFCTGGKTSDNLQQFSLIQGAMMFPGSFPGNVIVQGYIQPVTGGGAGNASYPYAMGGVGGGTGVGGTVGAVQSFTSNSVALPSVPGSGTTFWCIQVNNSTGALSTKTSSVAAPTADAGNTVICQHQIQNGDTIPWLRAPVLPESWP